MVHFRFFLLAFLYVIAIFSPGKSALAQADIDRSTLATNIRKSIVYLEVTYIDPNNSENVCSKKIQGTGFIITNEGYVLTVAHNLTPPKECGNFTKRIIEARVGYRNAVATSISASFINSDDRLDVGLIKLAQRGEPYVQAPLCNIRGNPRPAEKYIAYGFPHGLPFSPLDATYSNPDGIAGRWSMSSDFTHGMSGGPITDLQGRVIGLIQGGLTNTPAVRYVVPISYASNLIAFARLDLKFCDQVERGEPASSSDLREKESPTPQELAILKKEFRITNLKREVLGIIIDYESIDAPSDVLADKVRRQAAQVGRKLLVAPEKDVGIGHKITKYQYAAYAFMMSASYEPDLSESNELVAKGIDAGRRAVSLVDELRSLDKEDDPYLVYLESWVLENKVDERIKYILAILYAIKAKKNDDHSIFPDIENYRKGISLDYKKERPLEKNRYLKWYLSEKKL